MVTALPEGSTYRFWDKAMVAANWFDPAFDDSAWAQGPAPLGYGDPHIVTTISFGPNPSSKRITAWFRTTFEVKNAASITSATINILRDDGARVFLNGAEAFRTNMPNGNITTNTLASNLVVDAEETAIFTFSLSPALFVEGTNFLAVDVHQAVQDSTDMGIDMEITLEQFGP